MTVYEAYLNQELHPFTTRSSILFYCEIYGEFEELRKQYGYDEAVYVTADKKCVSEATVKRAISNAKVSIK
jgi:hypothetical protein